MMNLKQLDYLRKEKRAEHNIKQRDNYIEQLKHQLQIRDQLIKEKLGSSVSNFLKREATAGGNIVSLHDMEQLNEELILPALKLTKGNNFLKIKEDGEAEAPLSHKKAPSNGASLPASLKQFYFLVLGYFVYQSPKEQGVRVASSSGVKAPYSDKMKPSPKLETNYASDDQVLEKQFSDNSSEGNEEVKAFGGPKKPPLYSKKKNFAAEMAKNRMRY